MIDNMTKIIGFSGPLYLFLTPGEMYGEIGKLKSCHKNYKESDIYFLTKMKHTKFDEKFKKNIKGQVKIKVLVGDEKFKVSLDPVDYIFKVGKYKRLFNNKDELFFYFMHNIFIPSKKYNLILLKTCKKLFLKNILSEVIYINILKYLYSMEVKVTFLTPYTISIDEPFTKIITDKKKNEEFKNKFPDKYQEIENFMNRDFDSECIKNIKTHKLPYADIDAINFSIDQIINLENIDVGEQEILYIGQTDREPFERLLPHEKLQELTSRFLRNDKEAIVIHLFGFKSLLFGNSQLKHTLPNDKKKLSNKEIITILEAELINYFKPQMNSDYKDGIRKNWKHIKKLKNLRYSHIFVELDIDGQYCKFKTDEVINENMNQHIIQTSI